MKNKSEIILISIYLILPFSVVPWIYNGSSVPKTFLSGILFFAVCAGAFSSFCSGCVKSPQKGLPLAFFLLTVVSSSLNSSFRSLSMHSLTLFSFAMLFFLSLAYSGLSRRKLYPAFQIISLLMSLIIIYCQIAGLELFYPMGNRNWNASFLLLLLPVNLFCRETSFQKYAGIMNLFLTSFCILLLGSRSVMLASALSAAAFVLLNFRDICINRKTVLASFLFLILLLPLFPATVRRLSLLSPGYSSNSYRLMLAECAFTQYKNSPLLGNGPGTFPKIASVTQLKTGPSYNGFSSFRTEISHAHNEFFELLSDCGLLCFAAMLWVIVTAFRFLKKEPEFYVLIIMLADSLFSFPFRLPAHSVFFLTMISLALNECGFFRTARAPVLRYPSAVFVFGIVILGLSAIKNFANPFFAELILAKASFEKHSGHTEAALSHFQTALRLSPLNSRCYLGKAWCLHSQGNYSLSLEYLFKAEKISSSRDLFYLKGMNFYLLGQKEKAFENLKTAALMENKRDSAARKAFISLALSLMRKDAAVSVLEELLMHFPADKEVLLLKDQFRE